MAAGVGGAAAFTAIYGCILLYVTAQAVLLVQARHRKTSFKMGFNILTMVWSLLRTLDWIAQYDDKFNPTSVGYSIVHYLPQAVQFATFGLLVVFWVKVINRAHWRSTWKTPTRVVYALLTVGMTAITLVGSTRDSYGNTVQKLQQFFSGSIFLTLAVAFAWVTYHVLRMQPREYSRMFMLRPRTVAGVILMLFIVFVSRAAFDFITAGGLFTVSTSGSASAEDTGIFIGAYLWWEVVPIVALLGTVATGSTPSAGPAGPAPAFGVFGAIAAMKEPGSGGASPSDSEDETSLDRNPLVDSLLGGRPAGEQAAGGAPGAGSGQAGGGVSFRHGDGGSTGYEIPAGAVPPHLAALQSPHTASTFGTMRGGGRPVSGASGANTFHDAYEAYLQQQAIMAATGHAGGLPLDPRPAPGVYVSSAQEGGLRAGGRRDGAGGPGAGTYSSSGSGPSSRPGAGAFGASAGASSAARSIAERHTDGEFANQRRYDSPAGSTGMAMAAASYNARHGLGE